MHLACLTGVDDPALAINPEEHGWRAPFILFMHATLGVWHATHGRLDDAARSYARLPPPGSPRIPPFGELTFEALRIELATELGDVTALEAAYRFLRPYADLHVVDGAGATACLGSVQLCLGIAALATGRPDTAIRHLRTAVAVNDDAGFAPFAAQARYRLAAALHTRGRTADLDEAVGLAVEAHRAAEHLGMAPLAARAADLVGRLRAGGSGPLFDARQRSPEFVARGLTNRQIAAAAHISERTVRSTSSTSSPSWAWPTAARSLPGITRGSEGRRGTRAALIVPQMSTPPDGSRGRWAQAGRAGENVRQRRPEDRSLRWPRTTAGRTRPELVAALSSWYGCPVPAEWLAEFHSLDGRRRSGTSVRTPVGIRPAL